MRAPAITDIMRGPGLGEYETRYINVKDPPFRARGDALTDDTVAIQTAIDVAESKAGCTVFIPRGTFMFSNLVVDASKIYLAGEGMRATYLKAIAGTVGSLVTFGGTDYVSHVEYNGIRDLAIWGNGTATRGLDLNHLSLFRLDGVNITGCLDDALYLDEVWDAILIQLKINDCGAGGKAAIHIYNGDEDNCNNIDFFSANLVSNTGYDLWLDASNAGGVNNSDILFNSLKIERTAGSGETLALISGAQGNDKINFITSLFSGNEAAYGLHWDPTSGGFGRVIACSFLNRTLGGTAIKLDNGRHQESSNLFFHWDYDIDYQNLTNLSDLAMSDNRRTDADGGRITQIGPSTVWSWAKQIDSHEIIAFADGDTTPAVNLGRLFRTANTNPTTITAFDLPSSAEKITIVFGDSNTTIDFTGTNLHGNNGADFAANQYDHMTGVYDDGTDQWHFDVSDNTA